MAYSINFQTGVWGEVYIALVHIYRPKNSPVQDQGILYIHITIKSFELKFVLLFFQLIQKFYFLIFIFYIFTDI